MPAGSSRSNSLITNSVRPKGSSHTNPDLEVTSTRHKSLRSNSTKPEGSSNGLFELERTIARLKLQQLKQKQFDTYVKSEKLKKQTFDLNLQINRENETLKVIKLQTQLMELASLVERYAETLELSLAATQSDISTLSMCDVEIHDGRIREALDLYQNLIKHTILH